MLATLLLALPLQSRASQNPTVEGQLYQMLENAYTLGFGHKPCLKSEDVCEVEASRGYCLRFGNCSFTLLGVRDRTDLDVIIDVKDLRHLYSYIALRSAHASNIGNIEVSGSRYRPNFRFNDGLICTHVKSTGTFSCK